MTDMNYSAVLERGLETSGPELGWYWDTCLSVKELGCCFNPLSARAREVRARVGIARAIPSVRFKKGCFLSFFKPVSEISAKLEALVKKYTVKTNTRLIKSVATLLLGDRDIIIPKFNKLEVSNNLSN